VVRTRILSAALLATPLWALVHFAPVRAFQAVVLAALTLAMYEAYAMLATRGARPFPLLGIAGGWGVAACFWGVSGAAPGLAAPLVGIFFAALVAAMARRETPVEMLDAVWSTLFPVLFVALTASHLMSLRAVGEIAGRNLLYLLFLCVMLSDTAAYFVGSAIGKRRLAPRLSPKKSWEGAIAGLLASVGAAALARAWFLQEIDWPHVLVLGALLGAAGILGDLAESLLKRACGVKDSSRLIPGHGGMLDRTDSLLFAAPALYYYYGAFVRAAG